VVGVREKEDAEQASEEERKKLDGEKQQEDWSKRAQKKLDRDLITTVIQSQKIEKMLEEVEVLYTQKYQESRDAGSQLFQAHLELVKTEGTLRRYNEAALELSKAATVKKNKRELLLAVSDTRDKIQEDARNIMQSFLDKYLEKLGIFQESIDEASKKQEDIEVQIEKVNNDISKNTGPDFKQT
jgi:hypothetical protein